MPLKLHTSIRFLAVGALNTLIGLGCIYFFKAVVGLGDGPANVLGYAIGFTNSFFLNRSFTFGFKGRDASAALRFAFIALVGYGLNLWTVLASIHLLGANGYLAQAIGVVPYTVFTYFGFKHFAFRNNAART